MNIFKRKPKQVDWQQATKTMAAIEHCIKIGSIKINLNTNEAWILRDIHWNEKSDTWRESFITNLKTFMDMRRIMHKQEPKTGPISVYCKETKELLSQLEIK